MLTAIAVEAEEVMDTVAFCDVLEVAGRLTVVDIKGGGYVEQS